MYDYNKLLGRIKEYCGTNGVFASKIGISEQALYKKLYKGVSFKQSEIDAAISVLKIKTSDIVPIFFTKKVEKN